MEILPFKEKRAYTLQRDYRVLEREKRVTRILGNHAFRSELEGILQGQLDGSRGRPKLSQALRDLQENVVPAAALEAAHGRRSAGGPGVAAGSSIIPVNDLRGARSSRYVLFERQLRCKLASLCRLVDWFKWSQLLDNHISARGGAGEKGFLINPFGLLYSEVTASSLVRVNRDGTIVDGGSTQLGVNRPDVTLHSAIYSARRDVHCVMHLHTIAGAAVSLMSCGLLPISEEALSIGKVSYYSRPPAGQNENKRELAKALGKNKVLILRNHGLVTVGNSVEDCFHVMYNLIQACQIQVAAVSAGLSNLTQFPHGGSGAGTGWGDSGEDTVGVPEEWTTRGQMEFEALMRMLDNHGYQTGYKYRGLNLMEDKGDRRRRAAWDEVTEEGERRGRSQQAQEFRERTKQKKEVWSFLDDDRSRDKPLTKNTKIRVRTGPQVGGGGLGGSVSPVEEEEEEADPWQFLTSRESSVVSPGSKGDSRPSTAQNTNNTRGGRGGGGGEGSGTSATEDSLRPHSSSTGGRRRLRRKKKSNTNNNISSRTPGTNFSPHHHHLSQSPPSGSGSHPTGLSLHTGDTPLPPLDLTALEQTAERVAHSTGAAVEKLSLRRLMERKVEKDGVVERTHSEPDLRSTWNGMRGRDSRHSRLLVDSQGYSSGDEASYLGSPRRPIQPSTLQTETQFSSLQQARHRNPSPPLPSLPPPPPPLVISDISTPLHTSPSLPPPPPAHIPLHINYPPGASSAEKASLVARLVANSTGAAVQKLSESMTEKWQLSLSTIDSPNLISHTNQI